MPFPLQQTHLRRTQLMPSRHARLSAAANIIPKRSAGMRRPQYVFVPLNPRTPPQNPMWQGHPEHPHMA